jgi:3-dehydroquinate synthase
MRGVEFGFVPTSLLAMVDASIGGKNGIDVGAYKNMVGTIRQPSFLFYDFSFLKSLPDAEWSNGFAEIIKHACIRDAALFSKLEKSSLSRFKKNKKEIAEIVQRNVHIKSKIVQQDEFEQGDRKLLNFGHTLGHALETQYELTHGQAISLGMGFASWLSFTMLGFTHAQKVAGLLQQYNLPVSSAFDVKRVFHILKMDKKRIKETMHFILLKKLGKGVIREIEINRLNLLLNEYVEYVKSSA